MNWMNFGNDKPAECGTISYLIGGNEPHVFSLILIETLSDPRLLRDDEMWTYLPTHQIHRYCIAIGAEIKFPE